MSFSADLKDFVNTYSKSKQEQAYANYYNRLGGGSGGDSGDVAAWDTTHQQMVPGRMTEEQFIHEFGQRPTGGAGGANQTGGILGEAVRGLRSKIQGGFTPQSTGAASPGATPKGPGPNVSEMYAPDSPTGQTATAWAKFAKDHGYSQNAAIGIGGNIGHESSWDPSMPGDKGTSLGLAQWHEERKADFLKYAQDNKLNPRDPQTQFQYLDHDWRTNYPQQFAQLQKAKTPEEATFIVGKKYENPAGAPASTFANPSSMSGWGSRVAHARAFGNTIVPSVWGNTAPVVGSTPSTAGGSYAQNQQNIQSGAQPGSPMAASAPAVGGALPVTAPAPVSSSDLAPPTQEAGEYTPGAARGGPIRSAVNLASQGRHGDTMLAHVNPREAVNASGTNPNTGLPEFFEPGPGGPGAGPSGWGGGVTGGGSAPNDFSGGSNGPWGPQGFGADVASYYAQNPWAAQQAIDAMSRGASSTANAGRAAAWSAPSQTPVYNPSAMPSAPYSQKSTAGPYSEAPTPPARPGGLPGATYSNSVGDKLPAENLYGGVGPMQGATSSALPAMTQPTPQAAAATMRPGTATGGFGLPAGVTPEGPPAAPPTNPYGVVGQPSTVTPSQYGGQPVTLGNPPAGGTGYGNFSNPFGGVQQPQMSGYGQSEPAYNYGGDRAGGGPMGGGVTGGRQAEGGPVGYARGGSARDDPNSTTDDDTASFTGFRGFGGFKDATNAQGYLGGGAINGYAQGGDVYNPDEELARQGHFNARLHKDGFVPKNEKPIAHPSEISTAMAPRQGDSKDVWMGRLLGFEQHYPEFRQYARLHNMNIPPSKGGSVGQIRNLIDGFLHWKHGAGAQQMFAGGKVTQYADGGMAQNTDDDTMPQALPANAPYPQSSTAGPYAGSAPPPPTPDQGGGHNFGQSSRLTQAGPLGRREMEQPLMAAREGVMKKLAPNGPSATIDPAALHDLNNDVPDPQTYAQGAKLTGADQYPPVLAHTVYLHEVFKHDMEKGNVEKAQNDAAGLLMYLRNASMQYGEAAVQQLSAGDIEAAKASIKDGYGHFPDGKYLDENGDEVAVKDLKTGETYYKTKLTPNMIAKAAMGLKDGSAFLQQLASVGQNKLPESKNKAKDDTPSSEATALIAGLGQPPGATASPASTPASAAGAKAPAATTDDSESDTEEPDATTKQAVPTKPGGAPAAGATVTPTSATGAKPAPSAVPAGTAPASATAAAPAQGVPVGYGVPEPPRSRELSDEERASLAALPGKEQRYVLASLAERNKELDASHKSWEEGRKQWQSDQNEANKEARQQQGESQKQMNERTQAIDTVMQNPKTLALGQLKDPTTGAKYGSADAAMKGLPPEYTEPLQRFATGIHVNPKNNVDANTAVTMATRFTQIDDQDPKKRTFTVTKMKNGSARIDGVDGTPAEGYSVTVTPAYVQALNEAINARVAQYKAAGVYGDKKASAFSEGMGTAGRGLGEMMKTPGKYFIPTGGLGVGGALGTGAAALAKKIMQNPDAYDLPIARPTRNTP